jgi:hypothetical protein
MNRALLALGLLLAGCASQAVSTPDQARAIALASPCARMHPVLSANETLPTAWLAERRGDKWYAWLPYGPGAEIKGGRGQLTDQFGHMGAWIDARDGKVLSCERGGAEP